jgi:predicted RNA binding protein YcfA (HicA-like mRNA interferase family)
MVYDTVMVARELVRLLKSDGWVLVRVSGSHHIFKHPTKSGVVSVPIHNMGADVPTGLLNKLLKEAGLK